MGSYTLVVSVPGQALRRQTLSQGRAFVGREVGDVVLGDKECSSRHAELLWDGVKLVYRDLASTNGSFVGGQRVQELTLEPGVVVQIGSASLRLEAGAPRAEAPATVPAARPAAKAPQRSNRALLLVVGVTAMAALMVCGLLLVRFLKKASRGDVPGVTVRFGGGTPSGGETTVKAVWFSGRPGVKVQGGTSDITVRVTPNTKDGASVGVIEEFSGGTGNQWRTATWLAAFNASRAAGLSLVEHEYLVRAGGHIDGPSAGMLMTSTMLALLRGRPLRPGTTMTGTINPDGSAGPVGGIVQKMQGAKASGVTRFGYPMGARSHTDLADLSQVDLNEVGAALGLEVREIHDLHEAYDFMTGEQLQRPTPLSESELELDAETTARLRAKLTAWKSRLQSEVTQLKTSLRKQPSIGKLLNAQLAQIDERVAAAARFEKGDLPVAALFEYMIAALTSVAARDTVAMMESYLRGDLEGVYAQVDEARAAGGQVRAYGDELLLRARRQTVGGQVNTTLGLGIYVTASGYAQLAEDDKAAADAVLAAIKAGKLAASPEATSYMVQNLLKPVIYYHSAKVLLEFSRDYQDLLDEEGRASEANLAQLGREAGGYGSAAGAALAYFDAIFTETLDGQATRAQAQAAVGEKELGYLLAHRAVRMTEGLKSSDGDGAKSLLRLAAGASAYFTASGLVNKYYSLGGKEENGVLHITNRKSLTAQLEQARLHAREEAARAKQLAGFVPIAARLDYQLASAYREGNDGTKLEALQNYWYAAFWSHLAAQLATH